MKVVTTISENNSVNVKRYENNVCVGERNIRLVDYCRGMMKPLPMGAIFEHLITETPELEEYLKELNEPKNFNEFLTMLLKNLSASWYQDNPILLEVLAIAVSKLNTISVDNPNVVNFLMAVTQKVNEIPMGDNLGSLVIEILKRFLKENNKKELEQKKVQIFRAIISTLSSEQKEELQNVISKLTPHMDDEWFKQMIEQSIAIKQKITYFSGSLPPGLSYMGVSTQGTSYVYEVPKSRFRVKYHGAPIEDVGHPRLLAIYKLKNEEQVSSMKLVAVKENEEIHDLMDVYRYPYSHVFADGKVCWYEYGNFKKNDLPQIANLFLSTSNSNHGADCLKLYKENEGKDFDDSKLKPLGKLMELL